MIKPPMGKWEQYFVEHLEECKGIRPLPDKGWFCDLCGKNIHQELAIHCANKRHVKARSRLGDTGVQDLQFQGYAGDEDDNSVKKEEAEEEKEEKMARMIAKKEEQEDAVVDRRQFKEEVVSVDEEARPSKIPKIEQDSSSEPDWNIRDYQ